MTADLYTLYGLIFESPWSLPAPRFEGFLKPLPDIELAEGSEALFAEARGKEHEVDEPRLYRDIFHKDGSIYLRWSGLFEFLVSADGRRIYGLPLKKNAWESFKTYLLGQVLSYALLRRGLDPLHCTMLAVNGAGVGFLGDCGYGKSTLAAAFIQAGHSLVTDDLLVLKEEGKGYLAYPSIPWIKLFPETAKTFLGAGVTGSLMNPLTKKMIIPLGPENSCQTPVPLRAFFVLRPRGKESEARKIAIRALNPRRAFLDLTANTFNARVTDPDRLKQQFQLATRLAASVPCKSLSYPRKLDVLPQVVLAVVRHLSR